MKNENNQSTSRRHRKMLTVTKFSILNLVLQGCLGVDPSTCDCGWRQQVQSKIIGGEPTLINEYAFMAGLESTATGHIYCGASIVSKRYVLTTAKCCKDRPAGEIVLVVGNSGDATATRRYKIKEFIVHENSNGFNKNNIGLVRTTVDIKFSMAVGSICLPASYTKKDFTGLTVTSMGWGVITDSPTEQATGLEKVEMTIINQTMCQQIYRADGNTYMCTYAEDIGPCRRDNGGPLVWFDSINSFRNHLIGVLSNGTCGSEKPDIAVRITSYLGWIKEKTSDVPACYK